MKLGEKNIDIGFFKKHFHFESIDSTHLYAKTYLKNLDDGLVITADYQTIGKGRRNRVWLSPIGKSLLSTIVLKRGIKANNSGLITLITALSVSQLLDNYKVNSSIRWPNDVMVNGQKIAGILAEAVVENDKVSSIILSLGLNLIQNTEEMANIDRPATSLFIESGIKKDSGEILMVYLNKLFENLDIFFKTGFDTLAPLVRVRAELVGRKIKLKIGESSICCRVLDYANDGSIKIEDDAGKIRNLFAGEVERLET